MQEDDGRVLKDGPKTSTAVEEAIPKGSVSKPTYGEIFHSTPLPISKGISIFGEGCNDSPEDIKVLDNQLEEVMAETGNETEPGGSQKMDSDDVLEADYKSAHSEPPNTRLIRNKSLVPGYSVVEVPDTKCMGGPPPEDTMLLVAAKISKTLSEINDNLGFIAANLFGIKSAVQRLADK